MTLTRKYIIGSVIFHIVLLIITTVLGHQDNSIKKSFVVLGAHSSKPSSVTCKSGKYATPFVQNGSKNGSKASTKKSSGKNKSNNKKKKPIVKAKKQKAKKKKEPKQEAHVQKSKIPEPEPEPEEPVAVTSKKIVKKKAKKQDPKGELELAPEPEPEKDKEPALQEKPVIKEIEQSEMPDDESPQLQDNPEEGQEEINENIGYDFSGKDNEEKLLAYQKHIRHEIDRLWQPPVGVARGTICSVSLILADDGTVEKYDFINKSNVLIYDLSILRILKKFVFHKSLHGKQFSIVFRQ